MRTVNRTHVTHYFWAIESGETKPRYEPCLDARQPLRAYLSRREARDALAVFKEISICGQKARVVRVSVTVTTIGLG